MSRSYNGWDPSSHGQPGSANSRHGSLRDSRPGTRLPPPDSLVAGAPSGHSTRHPHPHPQPLPQSHAYTHPPSNPHPPPHQAPSHGPGTYTQHPTFGVQPPASYSTGHATNQRVQHHPPPSHISPSPSQASNTSSASFQDPRAHRGPQGQHQQPPYPPYVQHQPQQPTTYTQPPRRIAPATSATMGQNQSNSFTAPTPSNAICLNLLGEGRAGDLEGIKFSLELRQQPQSARSCGLGDKDRRVIDPPPIVALSVEGPKLSSSDVDKYMRYPMYMVSVSIYNETGVQDLSVMSEEYRHQRRLMGTPVTTAFFAKDEFNKDGCFFPFADLSCRTPGVYRLQFDVSMIALPPNHSQRFLKLAVVMSEPFTVYNAKDFPGMVSSSPLARRLKEQGCIISIKKGADKTKMRKAGNETGIENDSGDEDYGIDEVDDDEIELQGKEKRKRRE